MDDAALVRRLERMGDLLEDRERLGRRQWSARPNRSASVSPGTSSISRKVASPTSSRPCNVAIFGWLSEASTRASRSKRLLYSALSEVSSWRTLTATSRPSRMCSALYTSPMPPAPRDSRIRYGPTELPGDSRKTLALTRIIPLEAWRRGRVTVAGACRFGSGFRARGWSLDARRRRAAPERAAACARGRSWPPACGCASRFRPPSSPPRHSTTTPRRGGAAGDARHRGGRSAAAVLHRPRIARRRPGQEDPPVGRRRQAEERLSRDARVEGVDRSIKVLSTDATTARVSCRVTQTFIPKAGSKQNSAVTRVMRLRRQDTGWVIDGFER